MREKLEEKLRMYQEMKENVENEDYNAAIETKVAEYRESLRQECEKVKARKVEKIDTYIELLQSLIDEAAQEEAVQEENVEEAPVEEVVESTEEIKEEV